jgi:hypothetical protein
MGKEWVMRVDWVVLDRAARNEIKVGDLVSVEAGGAPIYRVLRISEDRAWLRDERLQMDSVLPTSLFHWKAHVHEA